MGMRIDNFRLYATFSTGIFIPYHEYNVLTLVEGADLGAPFIEKMPLVRPLLFAYTPRIQKVYNRILKTDINELRQDYGKRVTLLYNTNALKDRSFYYDVTPYVKYLKSKLSIMRFATEGIKFLKSAVDTVRDANKNTVLLYYFDETLLPERVRERELYSFMFTYSLRRMSYELGIPKIFLVSNKTVRLIYDSEQAEKNKYGLFMKWIYAACKTRQIISVEDEESDATGIETLQPTPAEEKPSEKDVTMDDLSPKKIDARVKKEEEKQEQVAKKISKYEIDRAVNDIVKNVYNSISHLNLSTDVLKNRLNTFAKSDAAATIATMKAYQSQDKAEQNELVKSALTPHVDPKLALITPIEVDPKNIQQQEVLSKHLGMEEVEPIDDIQGSDIPEKMVKNNVSHAIARRHGYQESLVLSIRKCIEEPLAEIGYSVVSISFKPMSEAAVEIFETVSEYVNIKCKDPDGNIVNLKFSIPKLSEDRFILSGGMKWFYPTIMSVLPIFIVRPHYVQLRTNYAAISYQYGEFNRREDVRCFVGGFKLPLALLLSTMLSAEGVLRKYKLNYSIQEKKSRMGQDFVQLPMADGRFLVIQRKTDPASRVIISGFEMMFAKYRFKNISNLEEVYECLKAFTKQNKSAYILRQVNKYLIDAQIEDVLKAHKFPTSLTDLVMYCAELAISGESEDKLDINNVYLRTTDIIVAAIEKGVHAAISLYKQQRVYSPNQPLKVNSAFVTMFFREQGVLQLLQQQNPVEEVSSYASIRIVGPGGLPNKDAVQPKDRSVRMSHFGNIDPVDTSEGDPGTRLFLANGHVYDDKQHAFAKMNLNEANTDILGPAASLTPYADRDDQARLIMASNQARQAVPVINSEVPMVCSGYESHIASVTSSVFAKRAKIAGKVSYVDENIIILENNEGKKEVVDIRPSPLKSGSGIDSAVTYTPTVKTGDTVKNHQLLATNEYIQPVLTQGVNAKCCYLSYMGYNYEDGIVVSESFAKKMTSLHYDTIEIELAANDVLKTFPAIGQAFEEGDTIVQVQRNVVGAQALTDEWEVIAPSQIKVVDISIYPSDVSKVSSIVDQIDEVYKTTNDKLKEHNLPLIFDKKKVIENSGRYTSHGEKLKNTYIVIKLLRLMSTSLGDKLTNRHAAKGVVTKILPDAQMPRTNDGEVMDIVINSLSVVSRMNTGQLHELAVGNILYTACKKVADMLKNNKNRKDIETFVTTLYALLDGTRDKTYSAEVAKNIKSMNETAFRKTVNDIARGRLHFIAAPFQSPSTQQLMETAKFVGAELEAPFLIPELGTKTKYPVAWGVIYIQKLEHISEIKQSARNVGPYVKTTLEPTRGKAKAGGQRMGELDTWCLLSYDAKQVLNDFWIVNGDNPEVKNQVLSDIFKKGSADINADVERSGSGQMFDAILLCMGVEP